MGRVRFFSAIDGGELTCQKLDRLLSSAAGCGTSRQAQQSLARAYLGFIVVRSIPSVPIGKTVLSFCEGPGDVLHTSVRFSVHLLGLELSVDGLAFQQQDRAVGACATVAIWTALQRLTRHEGARAPTPSEVTDAAVRHFVPFGRPFPSPGLTIEQICEALRALDFPPLVLDVVNPEIFKLRLGIYLRSGMPVILAVKNEEGSWGHAVTAVGFRDDPGSDELWPLNDHQVKLRNTGYQWIYVSDDRLGPYVPAELTRLGDGRVGM